MSVRQKIGDRNANEKVSQGPNSSFFGFSVPACKNGHYIVNFFDMMTSITDICNRCHELFCAQYGRDDVPSIFQYKIRCSEMSASDETMKRMFKNGVLNP